MGAALLWARTDARRALPSTLIVALLVALTGGAVIAGVAGAGRAGAATDRFFASSRWPNVVLFSEAPLDEDQLAPIRSDSRATSVSRGSVMVASPVGLEPGLEGAMMLLPDERWGRDTEMRLVAGRYPAAGAADEVVASEATANARSLTAGTIVDLHFLTAEALSACIDGSGSCEPAPAGRVEVVGVVRTPQDLTPDAYGSLLMFARPEFDNDRGGPDAATGHLVFVNLADGVDADAVAAEWSTLVPNGDVTSDRQDRGALDQAAELQRPALLVGAVIAAAAGGLVVGQAFSRLLARRRGDAEVLAALGLARPSRMAAAFVACLPAVALGSLGAVAVAVALSPLFPLRVLRRADPDVGLHADPLALALGAGATAGVACLLAACAAALWARRTPQQKQAAVTPAAAAAAALRLGPVATTGARFALERGRGPRAVPVVPALVGAVVGLAVTVSVFVISDSMDGLLASPARYGAPWHLQVGLGVENLDQAPDMASDNRVEQAAVIAAGELDLHVSGRPTLQVPALGYQAVKGNLAPLVLDGRFLGGPDEVAMATDTMRDLGVGIGDRIAVSGPSGRETMTVVGRIVKPIVGDSAVNDGVVVPLDVWRRIGALDLVAEIDGEVSLVLDVADPAQVDAVAADFEERGAFVDRTFRQAEVTVLEEVRPVPLMLAAFTGLLGALAAAHALVTAVRRRRHELAVLRALGLRPRQAAGVVWWQALVLTTVALAIAVPLGVVSGRLVWTTMADRLNVQAVAEVPTAALVALALAAIAGSLLFAALPATWAARDQPASALRDE
jgi:FtsX-like permease family